MNEISFVTPLALHSVNVTSPASLKYLHLLVNSQCAGAASEKDAALSYMPLDFNTLK